MADWKSIHFSNLRLRGAQRTCIRHPTGQVPVRLISCLGGGTQIGQDVLERQICFPRRDSGNRSRSVSDDGHALVHAMVADEHAWASNERSDFGLGFAQNEHVAITVCGPAVEPIARSLP